MTYLQFAHIQVLQKIISGIILVTIKQTLFIDINYIYEVRNSL
jgi:hypothetical protein